MSKCFIKDVRLLDWTRQQIDMALRVVKADDVRWRLDAEQPAEQLSRVGGLDISFVEAHPTSPAVQLHPVATTATTATAATAPSAVPAANASPVDTGNRGDADGCTEEGGAEPAAGPGVAALVVLSFPGMRVLYEDYEPVNLSIPYLPGYLGFRECDAYARLLRRVESSPHRPQVLLVDGCGVLHPRGCGSACQVGVTCDYPCVGVSKNLLAVDGLDKLDVRRRMQEAAAAQAAEAELLSSSPAAASERSRPVRATASAPPTASAARDVQVPLVGRSGALHGVALCPGLTRKPLFVSVGHRLSLATAVELVRRCCLHRVPEPIRQADLRSRQWLRDHAVVAAAGTG